MENSKQPEDPIRILVVDDEPGILSFLSKCFFRRGYTVRSTPYPKEALDFLSRGQYDLVLADIKMPEMDGLSLLKKIKESYPTVEVILMTGHATVDSAIGSMKLGAFDYISKPFNLIQILSVIQRAIHHRHSANQAARYQDWDHMKTEFLRNASHELRTPLTGIKAASKLLLEEYRRNGRHVDGPVAEKMLSAIDRNSDKMVDLIDNILDAFRYDSGKVTLNPAPFSVEKLLLECVEEFLAPCRERGLDLSASVEPGLPLIWADPVKIRQAFLNLLGNAMKFTLSGGRILLGAKRWGWGGFSDYLEISIEDTGIGIPKEAQEKIFEKFFQVDGSVTQAKQGLGLGLALAKAIVESHRGVIHVESAPGKGSKFKIILPVRIPERMPPGSVPSSENVRGGTSAGRGALCLASEKK